MAKSSKSKTGGSKMKSLNRSRAGSIVLCRILIIVLVDVIVSSLFDYLAFHSYATVEGPYYLKVRPVLVAVFGVLLLASIAYLVITLVKKIDTSAHFMTPAMITAVCLYLMVVNLFYNDFKQVPLLFYTMTAIVSVMFAVYYVYTILFYKK